MTNKKSIIKFAILIMIIAGAFFAFRYIPLSQYARKEELLNLLSGLYSRSG